MSRKTEEWIGSSDDAKVPPRVKLRVFHKYEGRCYLSGRQIRSGEAWDLEHITALCNGGEHRESNFAPALREPHKIKTKADRREKKKVDATRKKHLGIKKSGWTIPGRKFDGTPIPSRVRT